MKKRAFLLVVLIIAVYIGIVYSQGGSTSFGLTIIDTQGPIINLINPINNSGFENLNITFLFNVSDANTVDNCSLIINDKVNITETSITKNTGIEITLNNTAVGSYNWSINCTDNLSFVSSSPNRTVTVLFALDFNGTSTNLSGIDIRNITNFVIEVTTAGQINFSDTIDLSQGFDLNKFINISFNRIELNSTALSELNKSATLSFFNLTFSNPRVLRDGVVCPSTICKEVSFSKGKFIFNVTHFTVYSSEETPAGGGTTGGTGGGGGRRAGGVSIAPKTDFTIDKKTLKVILRQGQTKEESFSIKNTGATTLDVTTYLQALRQFVFSPTFDEIVITLNPDEYQIINLVFGAPEDLKPDVYTGEIRLKSGTIEKIIGTIIEVESAKPLFDVDVEVLPEYRSVLAGEEIFIDVSLFNVRGFGRVDVILEYSIKDFEGNLLAKEEETVAVETQAKFVRELFVPSDTIPGDYVATVKVTFDDSVGISSDVFEVRAKAIRLYPIALRGLTTQILVGIIIVLIIASVFLIYYFGLPKKKQLPKTREEESKLIKSEEKTKKYERELAALEKAFKSQFISEESYKKGKERVEKELKKLGK